MLILQVITLLAYYRNVLYISNNPEYQCMRVSYHVNNVHIEQLWIESLSLLSKAVYRPKIRY